jgi:phage terminase small subunit
VTLKRRRFVDAYLGSANGNATQAAIDAGFSRKTAKSMGSQLLTFIDVRKAIEGRVKRTERKAILTAEQRDARLSMLALSPAVPAATQVAAIKELNKCSGRHSIKHVLDVTETLSDIITASRAPQS